MSKIEDKVKEILSDNFNNVVENVIPCSIPGYEDRYVDDYNMNLYRELSKNVLDDFKNGSGNELLDQPAKMKAKHSSSAFGVNLFGYDKIKIKANSYKIPKGKYDIKYEKQLPTIKGSNAPANVDVYLTNENCAVFIEVKLTEPILEKKKQEISSSYLKLKNYYINNDMGDKFIKAFEKLSDNKTHQYDAMQMMKHLLGICNTIEDKNSELKGKKIFLINCHCWNPLIDEKSDFNEIGKKFIESVNDISKKYNITVLNIDHKQMMKMMEMDEGRCEYVTKRYDLSGLKG